MKKLMIKEKQFEVNLTTQDCKEFAEISGDWNPLHTNPEYSATSVYGKQVLHGAYSAGLISRLAGMYIPGKECLLYGMKLKFVNPIIPPLTIKVVGKLVRFINETGKVEVIIINKTSGELYVEATYEFGLHTTKNILENTKQNISYNNNINNNVILVTGANGALGNSVLNRLGNNAIAIKRNIDNDRLSIKNIIKDLNLENGTKISAIIHCGWPKPDNRKFIDIENDGDSIEYHIGGPLKDIQTLSNIISKYGIENAPLILIGSTAAQPGRHNFRMPLYSIAKSTIPTLVNLLSLELSNNNKRCYGVIFDLLDGGMNKGLSEASKIANADKSPWGILFKPDDAASQIIWLLENQSKLLNGSIINLTGGVTP